MSTLRALIPLCGGYGAPPCPPPSGGFPSTHAGSAA